MWVLKRPMACAGGHAVLSARGRGHKGAGLGAGYSHHSRLAEDPVQERTLSRCPKARRVLQAHYWQFLGAAFL